MANMDLYAGLLTGLNRGLESYITAQDKKKDRDVQMGLLKAEKGLIQQPGSNEFTVDPEFIARKRKEDLYKAQLANIGQGELIGEDESGNLKYLGKDPKRLEEEMRLAQLKNEQDPFGNKALAAQMARMNIDEKKREKTPEGKIEKLSGEARARFDNVTGSIDALKDIRAAYEGADRTGVLGNMDMVSVPLRGDTPFTEARNRFNEFLGRMQSGGQISKDEKKSFQAMLPGPTDKPEIAKSKLENLDQVLGARLKTFGVDEASARDLGFLKPRDGLVKPGLLKAEQTGATQLPKIGDVVDGYRYKGGDRSKQENWEQVKAAGR